MYRLMQPSDRAAVVALWQKERGDTAEFINTAMDRFAGEQNVYVAEENGQIEAAALAVPVTLQGRPGNYLFGLCGQGSLILAGLVDTLCAQQKLRGAGFTVAAPTSPERAALLQDKGFQKAFALRCLPREVERNLWSQAEFDSVTAKKLCELRERFWPDTVMLTPEKMAVVLGDLYSRGATIVSSEQGYGIYFRKEDTLYFVELMAEDDRSAEKLMEAAREKEVIVEKAVITVGAAQNLFLGEGTRQDYGMIRFEGEPFDVSESYKKLCELRERFWPDTVMLTPEKMAVVLGDLYSRGATIVSSEQGYGIYFRKEDTLYFVELMAEDDRSAEKLMEAAREKEVIVEKAVITVGAAQNLFLGEGTRQDYGMIRFEGEPFDVSESYMRLMLENG